MTTTPADNSAAYRRIVRRETHSPRSGFAITLAVLLLLVAAAMAVGALVARVLDGKLDLKTVADAFRGRRSSS